MTEDFLHYVWQFRKFESRELTSTQGESIQVISPGRLNTDAGPDFFNAQVKVGNTQWAGNVEIHIRSSDWAKHGHSKDGAYDNIILHVVFEDDLPVKRKDGSLVPTIVLNGRIPGRLLDRYRQLVKNRHWIPCAPLLREVDSLIIGAWLDRLLVERLEMKTARLQQMLESTGQDWETVFYYALARNFGMKVNAVPFELLAKSTPLLVLAKHKHRILQLEALLFGQAGMLEAVFRDNYPKTLQKEYSHLRHKYTLEPVPAHTWKFARLRPANFPTIRIAQFAHLVSKSSHLFSKVLEAKNAKELQSLFTSSVSDYWLTHYRFDKISAERPKRMGEEAIRNILINTVAPTIFLYAKAHDNPGKKELAIQLLEDIRPESNKIIRKWNELGIEAKSAADTQALIHLKTMYCDPIRCLQCSIGNRLLNR